MIHALVFDCFGVLTTDGWLPFADKYFGHDLALHQAARNLNKACDSGIIEYNEYIQKVAEMAGVSAAEAHRQIEGNVANERLRTYIADLKRHYKIGMLSNAGQNWMDHLFSPEQVALFDAVVLSCDLGFVKPDPRMYRAVCERLQVAPEEALYVDDIDRYVAGATDVGMHGIVYTDFNSLKHNIDALLR